MGSIMGIRKLLNTIFTNNLWLYAATVLFVFPLIAMEGWDYQFFTPVQEETVILPAETSPLFSEDSTLQALFKAIEDNDFDTVATLLETPYFDLTQEYKGRSIALEAFRKFAENRDFKDMRIFLYALIKGAPLSSDDSFTIEGYIRGYKRPNKESLSQFYEALFNAVEGSAPDLKAAAFYRAVNLAKPFLVPFTPRATVTQQEKDEAIDRLKTAILLAFGQSENTDYTPRSPLEYEYETQEIPTESDYNALLNSIKTNNIAELEAIDPRLFTMENIVQAAWQAFKKRGYKDARALIYLVINGAKIYPTDTYEITKEKLPNTNLNSLLNTLIDASSSFSKEDKALNLYKAIELALPFLKSTAHSAERNAVWLKNEVLFKTSMLDVEHGETEEELKKELEEEWEFLEKPRLNK
jgi:hypothetical protein